MKRGLSQARRLALIALLAVLCAGCGEKKDGEARQKLEFTVVDEGRLPEELRKTLEEKKEESFKLTYADGGYMYLCVGYGKQESGGYSIAVKDLYATENEICLDTDLIGPKEAEDKSPEPSYPYLVIKTPFVDKTVVFD